MRRSSNSLCGIYCLIMKRGKKPPAFYIGHALSTKSRFVTHLKHLREGRHINRKVQRTFRKYGRGCISWQTILVCEPKKEMLELYEQAVLDFFVKTYGRARILNISLQCVGSRAGVKSTRSHCKKISKKLTGIKRSESTREKISESKSGVKLNLSLQERAQRSQRAKDSGLALLGNKAACEANRGKKKSPEELVRRQETRRRNAEKRGRWFSQQWSEKQRRRPRNKFGWLAPRNKA